MDAGHKELLHQVAISTNRELDELADAIHDIEMDFPALIGAFEQGEGEMRGNSALC